LGKLGFFGHQIYRRPKGDPKISLGFRLRLGGGLKVFIPKDYCPQKGVWFKVLVKSLGLVIGKERIFH